MQNHSPKTILLVDDEQGLRTVLRITLIDMGYTVHTAADGEAALALFEEIAPPVVLTDIKMPGMDGIELLRRIKQAAPDTEVIMITGHGDIDLAIKSIKFEATDFVTKPINNDALEIALNRAAERIEMRRQLRQYTLNLESLVAEKTRKLLAAERLAAVGQTVAGLAHAIKNIAGGLKGGTFVLEKGIELHEEKYLQQGWQMVRGNVDKIANLSLDLLNYAKQAEVGYVHEDPNRPLKEVFELMQSKAGEQGIRMRCRPAPDLSAIAFDPELMHRALLNLVINALDACRVAVDAGSVCEVVLSSRPAADGGVVYEISDTGCGMDDAIQSKIFQSFFSTKGSDGTGIGLMLTQKIIDGHGGRITVSSREQAGSTFTVAIPPGPSGSPGPMGNPTA